jgi:hypothetical protein
MLSEDAIRRVAELADREARFDDPRALTFERFPYARLMTVEIEAEPADLSASDADALGRKFLEREWETHQEPSLSKRGVEFVSPTTAGDTLDEEVRFAVGALREAGYEATPWASVHVHVDARDMSQRDVGKIVLFSGLNQDSLYQVCPRHRYNSPFCQPFPRAFLDALEARLRDEERCDSISDVWEHHLGATMGYETAAWHMPSRWYGVNCRPFRTQGSIEWRMFNEPLDADAILRWCEVVHQIVDRGASMGLDEIAEPRDWPGFFGSLGLRPGTHAAMRERRRRHWLSGRRAPDYSGLPTVQTGGPDAAPRR